MMPTLDRPAPAPRVAAAPEPPKVELRDVRVWYGASEAVRGVTLAVPAHQVTAFIGPSGCGKSTLLRAINRMNDLVPGARVEGDVLVDGHDVYRSDPVVVRRRVGMVFQKPNPFPKSIYQNVAWGARVNGFRGDLDALVERSLRQAALWDEVKGRLREPAYALSGGQQQRLCIARALAVEPDVLLMDEPASALDPIATARLEETIRALSRHYTIVVVTHNLQQARRVAERTAFFLAGELVEDGETARLFEGAADERTRDYLAGRFG